MANKITERSGKGRACVRLIEIPVGLIHSNDPYYLCLRSCCRGMLLTINKVVDP
jgi:hypothetical protein